MRKLTLILVPLLLVACEREPAAPAASSSPAFDFTNNWDNGNPAVVRYEGEYFWLIIDPVTDRFSLQGGDPAYHDICGVPVNSFTMVHVQDIVRDPDDPLAAWVHELAVGRGVYIEVFRDWAEFEASGLDCSLLPQLRLAAGTGSMVSTDNDLYAPDRDNKNANAFGLVADGRLQLAGGGTARYHGYSRCVWDGLDGTHIGHCATRITLR